MRPDKNEYYFSIVEAVASRATCDRGKAGAVLVKDGRIIATGYAGAPAGAAHCDEVGHEFWNDDESHCVRTVHAELNALLQAARYGPPTNGATMYCTMFPCYACAKAMVNAGVAKVFALYDYHASGHSKRLFTRLGVRWVLRNPEFATYGEEETDGERKADPGDDQA